jgi:hypothetical protein
MTPIVKCKAVDPKLSVSDFFLVRLIFTMFPDELKRCSDAAELTGISHYYTACVKTFKMGTD